MTASRKATGASGPSSSTPRGRGRGTRGHKPVAGSRQPARDARERRYRYGLPAPPACLADAGVATYGHVASPVGRYATLAERRMALCARAGTTRRAQQPGKATGADPRILLFPQVVGQLAAALQGGRLGARYPTGRRAGCVGSARRWTWCLDGRPHRAGTSVPGARLSHPNFRCEIFVLNWWRRTSGRFA